MHRKKPYSVKQKKQQLQDKRRKKQDGEPFHRRASPTGSDDSDKDEKCGDTDAAKGSSLKNIQKINQQPGVLSGKYDPNKYRLHFFQDSKEVLAKKKEKSRQPYKKLPEESLEILTEIDLDTMIDIPKRPPWDYSLSKQQLEANEEKYFRAYVEGLFTKYSLEELSYFELNLETWRQLWRVLEMSEIFLIIADIRHPDCHFPPALYRHITEDLKKSAIMILNKVDLAPPALVIAWQHYFKEKFPLVDIVCFTSYPKTRDELEQLSENMGKAVMKRRKRGTYRALGPKELFAICQRIVKGQVDLSSWESKIESDIGMTFESDSDEEPKIGELMITKPDLSFKTHEQFKDGQLTIGCVGFPNVGKSSVINGLMGKKVVSVSRTPGHTKHFQTIYITPNVRLCDCPGLVFPSRIDKDLQILGGIFPIAQVREPYSTVCYLAERIDIPKLLKLKPVDEDEDVKTFRWSAMDICESWAEQRGYLTAKAARLDTYRAANSLLRLAVDGRLCLCMYPPGYTKNKVAWMKHLDTEAFIELQMRYRTGLQACAQIAEELDEQFSSNEEESVKQTNNKDSDNEESRNGRSHQLTSVNPFAVLGHDD